MCRAAAEAAAQSELAALVCAHREDEEEGEDCTAAQQTHRFVRGVAGATPLIGGGGGSGPPLDVAMPLECGSPPGSETSMAQAYPVHIDLTRD